MTQTLLYIVYILAAIYFICGIVAIFRYDRVTRKADKMLDEINTKEEQC